MTQKRTTALTFCSLLIALLLCTALIGIFLIQGRRSLCPHPSFEERRVAPTCSEEGGLYKKCTVCGYEYLAERIPCSEHHLLSMTLPATCEAQGYTLYYCECGYSYRADFTAPLEHRLKAETVEATCSEAGCTKYTCEVCGYCYEGDFCEPNGHSFSGTLHRPTATSAGYTDYVCECSYSYRGDYVYYSDILESAFVSGSEVRARGIDVSRWNHQIDAASGDYLPLDWEAIKADGVDFVIIKAGSTKSGIEPTFFMDYAGARAAGLDVGAYFYTYSTTVEGIRADAKALMGYLEGKQFEYPIYLDLEDSSLESLGKNHLSKMCEAFITELQNAGYFAALYSNHNWLTYILDSAKIFSLYDVWYARYPLTEKPTWNEEKYGRQLGMWQYSESGEIDGLEGYFDLNYAYRDYPEIMKKWGLNGF